MYDYAIRAVFGRAISRCHTAAALGYGQDVVTRATPASWAQLGLHQKPCGVLNVEGYFDRLLDVLDHAVGQRFMSEAHRRLLLSDDDPTRLLDRLADHRVPQMGKWLDRDST